MYIFVIMVVRKNCRTQSVFGSSKLPKRFCCNISTENEIQGCFSCPEHAFRALAHLVYRGLLREVLPLTDTVG